MKFSGDLFYQVKNLAARLGGAMLSRIISHMARTGVGTESCLRHGALPLPVDFHSPVPDLKDLESRKIWERRSGLAGIEFRTDAQMALLLEIGQKFGQECKWPLQPTGDTHHFYLENQSFSFGCAAGTHCLLRQYKPRRVIEIGSGNSSLVISGALSLNNRESAEKAAYIIVDPFPRPEIKKGLPALTQLVADRAELLEAGFFQELGKNDILFIDSGHVVRMGSDVNFLILDVLPRLASGVIIHFHDIALPYEYPKVYATNPKFRVFWTEAYLLQAFLCHNSEFEVLLAMNYLMRDHPKVFHAAFPSYERRPKGMVSGSFWIRRK